jgi:hypothetical protein
MIKRSNFRGKITNLHRIYFEDQSIGEIYLRGIKIWPLGALGEMILSCYYNGYWADEYPWTDDTPWHD